MKSLHINTLHGFLFLKRKLLTTHRCILYSTWSAGRDGIDCWIWQTVCSYAGGHGCYPLWVEVPQTSHLMFTETFDLDILYMVLISKTVTMFLTAVFFRYKKRCSLMNKIFREAESPALSRKTVTLQYN